MNRKTVDKNDDPSEMEKPEVRYSGYGLNVVGDKLFVAQVSNHHLGIGFDDRGGSGIMTMPSKKSSFD